MTTQNSDAPAKLEEYEHSLDPKYKALIAFTVGLLGTITLAWILGGPFGSVMKDIQGTWVYHFIPFIFSFSLFIFLIYKAYIQNIRGLSFLGTAVLLHGLAEFLNMFSSGKGEIFDRFSDGNSDYTAAFADLLFPIAVIFLYLHIELIDRLRPGIRHSIGIIGTAAPLIAGGGILIGVEFFDLGFNVFDKVQEIVLIYLGLFALVILWISIFGFRVMYKTMSHADSPEVSNGSFFVLIGFSSLLTNFILFATDYSAGLGDSPLIIDGNEFEIHNTWLITFALAIVLMAYILNPGFAYSIPFDVYQLLVINSEQGVTLFSYINEFRTEGSLTHAALKSPAIVAIQNLVQEIAHAEGHIILIGMSDRVLIMKSKEQIVSVLICERNSYFINQGLDEFTNNFYNQFESHIVNFVGNVDVFKDAKQLVHQHLPFMRKESLKVPEN
ncbi:MAG: hypothetical protein HeimC2_04210 [Candidatus Heimdallarchaeota archaeon LC_2]|nr:MAG: hypothetical protein HeimC2_04210 [Candidatus Heimdallarchaeota archaeon LC_2]